MLNKRRHPEEIPNSESKVKRRKAWHSLSSTYKSYTLGDEISFKQQDLALDVNSPSNQGQPLPSDSPHLYHSSPENTQFPAPEQLYPDLNNPNRLFLPARRHCSNFKKTLFFSDRQTYCEYLLQNILFPPPTSIDCLVSEYQAALKQVNIIANTLPRTHSQILELYFFDFLSPESISSELKVSQYFISLILTHVCKEFSKKT